MSAEFDWPDLEDGPGPAPVLSPSEADARVDAALAAAAQADAPAPAPAPSQASGSAKSFSVVAGAAILLTAAVTLAAGLGAYFGVKASLWDAPAANEETSPAEGPARRANPQMRRAPTPPAPELTEQDPNLRDTGDVDEASDLDETSALGEPSDVEETSESTPRLDAESRPRRARALMARETANTAPDLLLAANRARGERRFSESLRLYRTIAREHPGSDEAYVATVAAGSILLSALGNAAGARHAFQRALSQRPNGPLSEEARFGLAESLRRAGATDAARQAYERYLASHPGGVRAQTARARLGELAGEP